MPKPGDIIEGHGGFRLELVQTGAETDGELLVMEVSYGGATGPPPEHLHPRQGERFEVLEGTLRMVIGGAERVYEAADRFDVPAGTPHQISAQGPGAHALGVAPGAPHGRVLRAPLRRWGWRRGPGRVRGGDPLHLTAVASQLATACSTAVALRRE